MVGDSFGIGELEVYLTRLHAPIHNGSAKGEELKALLEKENTARNVIGFLGFKVTYTLKGEAFIERKYE